MSQRELAKTVTELVQEEIDQAWAYSAKKTGYYQVATPKKVAPPIYIMLDVQVDDLDAYSWLEREDILRARMMNKQYGLSGDDAVRWILKPQGLFKPSEYVTQKQFDEGFDVAGIAAVDKE